MATTNGLPATKTVKVSHLGGTTIGYKLPKPIVGSKPTLILIPGFSQPAGFFKPQLTDATLSQSMNLLVLEPLGHGLSKTNSPTWTAWDSAYAFIQAMDALGVKKALVLGSSQGGWIAARMALYAPEKILGLIFSCSIMDNVGPRLEQLGCSDPVANLGPIVTHVTAEPNPKFAVDESWSEGIYEGMVGPDASDDEKKKYAEYADEQLKQYTGDEGRLRLQQATIALLTRDSLLMRIPQIKAPVLWICGSKDKYFPEKAAKADIGEFKVDVQFELLDSFHAPTLTKTEEVHKLVSEFAQKHAGTKDARALREAVGMVDI